MIILNHLRFLLSMHFKKVSEKETFFNQSNLSNFKTHLFSQGNLLRNPTDWKLGYLIQFQTWILIRSELVLVRYTVLCLSNTHSVYVSRTKNNKWLIRDCSRKLKLRSSHSMLTKNRIWNKSTSLLKLKLYIKYLLYYKSL